MEFQRVVEICQVFYYIALGLTGPVALLGFLNAKKREQHQREEGTIQSLDEKYLNYLKLCLQYPHLDVFDYPQTSPRPLTDLEKKQELILFTILVSLFEMAFLMYRGHAENVREKQWEGWVQYIEDFGKRANFREAWKNNLCKMFDTDFQQFIESKFQHL